MNKRKLIIFSIFVIVAIFGFLVYKKTTAPKSLFVHKAKIEEFTESVVLDGTLVSKDDSDLAFESSGMIVWIGVKEGDIVKKGQAVAQLDTRSLKEDLNTALNNSYLAQSEIYEFEEVHKDDRDDPDTIHAKNQLEKTKVNADVAAEKARVALSKALLIAPVDGTVITVNKKVGEYASFGQVIIELSNKKNFVFKAELSEDDISKVEVGDIATLKLDAFPDLILPATLDKVLPKIIKNEAAEKIINLRFNLNEGQAPVNLISGLSGEAEIILESKSGIGVPFESIISENGSDFVYILQGGKARKVKVELGSDFGNLTEIMSGVSEGDLVVVEGVSKLKDGKKITPNLR